MFAFPWGEGDLTGFDGPDKWQRDYLIRLGEEIKRRGFDPKNPIPVDPVQMAVASGHGIGKGALTAMLVCFILDTRPRSMGMVTANTATQLRTKTFAEIVKWRRRSITAHWYDISTGEMWVRSKRHAPGTCGKGECNCPNSWRIDAITWRKEQSEAFAGLHAVTASPFYIFDEASAIDESIFQVSEGGLVDGEPFRFIFGNPTRNTGAFFGAFHKNRHRWITFQIDSRTCKFPNKRQMQAWIDDFGEDSDFVRVRVKGQFPRAGSNQMIPNDVVERARYVEVETAVELDVVVIGVDVARFGEDESVIHVRRGKDARSYPVRHYRGLNTMQLAARVIEVYNELLALGVPPAGIMVDGGGVGGGVVDRLSELGYPVYEVNFGGGAESPDRYLRKDAEMWDRMKAWLDDGGAIPDDEALAEQLTTRPYDYSNKMQLFLWSKKDCKEKLALESPDRADALALTFAEVLAPRTLQDVAEETGAGLQAEYDPYDDD